MPGHPPSQARAIVQRLKAGRLDVEELAAEARAIADPSFAAEGLFAVASDPRVPSATAARIASEVVALVHAVPRDWRKAELLTDLASRLPRWREGDPGRAAATGKLQDGFLQACLRMHGKDLSAACAAVAGAVTDEAAATLLRHVLAHAAAPADDAKAVLAASGGPMVQAAVAQLSDPALRARLLAYAGGRTPTALAAALDAAAQAAPEARLEAYRGLINGIPGPDGLATVEARLPAEPELRARLLCALAARADRLGQAHRARDWFDQAAQIASSLPEKARAAIERNVTAGLERLGGAPRAQPKPGAETPPRRAADDGVAEAAAGRTTAATPAPMEDTSTGGRLADDAQRPMRHALALCDTYEGHLGDSHHRAIARAAPLCLAFDLDLVLLGFPTSDADALVREVGQATRIGGDSQALAQLHGDGRVLLVPLARDQPLPSDAWEGLGLVVATTSRPDPSRAGDLPDLLEACRRLEVPRVVLVMGLGHKGLPPSLLRAVPHHYEITGSKVSLETATAMGILAERLRTLPTLPAVSPAPRGAAGP